MGACSEQVTLFKSLFGEEVEMTRENVLQYGVQFDLSWLASNIMSEAQYADCKSKRASLYADYKSKCAPLLADYESKCAPLLADYKSKCVSLFADILGL
jgi:predicted  nucleic acid-binding Zn ribbon protein